MTVSTVIKNCQMVNTGGILKTGIAIDGEKIVAIAKDEMLPPASKVIDANGNYVIPGLVDAHMHLGRPELTGADFANDIRTATQACAAGGVTTNIHMVPNLGDDLILEAKDFLGAYEKNGYIDVSFTTAIWTISQVKQIQRMADFGVVGFKLLIPYRGEAAIPGRPGLDDGVIYMAFQEISRLAKQGYRIHARVHCENIEIFFKIKERFLEQGIEPHSWHETRPNFVEAESMHRCIYLAGVTGCPLYIVHMTIGEGVDIVRKAKCDGVDITSETCPQYLVQNVNNTSRVFSLVNPPIRNKKDNDRLWEGVRDGIISVVATDFSTTQKERKKDIWTADCGSANVQWWLPVMLSEGVNKGRISLEKLVEVCCSNPAKIYGLWPDKGTIEVGSDADLTIVDLNKEAEVSKQLAYADTDINEFEGWKLKGWPTLTMVRGNVVMEDGKILSEAGFGRYYPAVVKEG